MIPQFALRLIFGMSLTWCVMPKRDVTSGFFRIQMLVTMGLGVLATLTLGPLSSFESSGSGLFFRDRFLGDPTLGLYVITIGATIASFLGSVMWTLERRAAGIRYAFVVLAASAIGLMLETWGRESVIPHGVQTEYIDGFPSISMKVSAVPFWFQLLTEFSGGWIIGGAISTMLLGHWYLTATGMPIAPLQQLNALLLGAVIVRTLLAAAVFGWAPPLTQSTQWVWLALRWAGLIGPVILVPMVFRVLRYRNTQSATGVLYAIDILIFLGETTAALLAHELMCPF